VLVVGFADWLGFGWFSIVVGVMMLALAVLMSRGIDCMRSAIEADSMTVLRVSEISVVGGAAASLS